MRVLALSASAGAGHVRAAEAVADAARAAGHESLHLDALKFTSRGFRTFYAESYAVLAAKLPALWGALYKSKGRSPAVDKLVKSYDTMAYHRLMRKVVAFAPDAVVATHFLPANVIVAHKGRGARLPVHVVATDFDIHPVWFQPEAASYCVASDEVRVQLERMGFPAARIRVTGIPLSLQFADAPTRGEACRRLGMDASKRRALMMAGGFGLTDLDAAVERLLAEKDDFDIVAVAGKNERLRRKLSARKSPRLRVTGFIKNVPDYMAASDVAVTKAGGLTVSECLAMGLPMVIYSPIPGQEEHNTDYLLERGAAVKARQPDLLDYKVRELLADGAKLEAMKRTARAMARPCAAQDVVAAVTNAARGQSGLAPRPPVG